MDAVAAIDLGGTKLTTAIVDAAGKILDREKVAVERGNVRVCVEQLTHAVRHAIGTAGVDHGEIRAIGIVIPGIYAAETGNVWAPNLWGHEQVPLRTELARSAGRWYGRARKIPMPGPNLEVSRQIAWLARRSSPPLRENALAAAKQAAAMAELGSAERFNALYQSAMLAILTGDLPLAEAKLRAAIDAAPTWYRARMVLASVLWATGRSEKAEREAALALKCAGRMEPEVKRILNNARARATAMTSGPTR